MGRTTRKGAAGPATGYDAALNAVAEAIVLADPADPSTFQDLLRALDGLGVHTAKGAAGDAARDRLADIAVAAGRLMHGKSRDVAGDMASLAHGFADVRRALEGVSVAVREDEAETQMQRAQPFELVNPLVADPELVADFVNRAGEHLDSADEHLLTLEREPEDREALDAVFRVFHTIKGMAGFLGFVEIEGLAHETESLLDGPRKDASVLAADAFDMVFAAVDAMRGLVAGRGGAQAPEAAPAGAADPDIAATGDAPEDVPQAGPLTASTQVDVSARIASTRQTVVRVDEERLDRLLDAIGELVIAESMTSEAARLEAGAYSALADRFVRLDKITRELQQMATSLRMVPLRVTFRTMGRLVRDLAHKAGKDVSLVTHGEQTELDKAMVDLLADPLIHLLRNAVDHGIESAEARAAAGKPAAGRIELRAYHAGGTVCVEVVDDGRGIDAEAVLARARSLGLVAEGHAFGEHEVLDLIFRPGFSTAATVTDVSGRGVGMDVVKRAVESVRGSIEVVSRPGEGTRFVMRLPLTLAIIDAMVVRVGGDRYIIPTLNIRRSVRPEPGQVTTVVGRGEVMSQPDGLVPLIRLDRVFGCDGASQDPTSGIVVIVEEAGASVGLVAEELLGQQQTVIKPLGEGIAETPGISGGAVMPDGTVGLIVDVSGLVRVARSSRDLSAPAPVVTGPSESREGVNDGV